MSHGEKLYVLMMDESSLKQNLYYDAARDHLVCLEDYTDGTSYDILAHSALLVLVCGIAHNWKQPATYYLVSEGCVTP